MSGYCPIYAVIHYKNLQFTSGLLISIPGVISLPDVTLHDKCK